MRGITLFFGLARASALILPRCTYTDPEVAHVDTWNADVNAPMLSINHAMGFRRLRSWQAWRFPV